jgi:mono/diheme cytochrome c family protein
MVYASECASCHLDDLSGGATSPPLKGDEFLSSWKGKTVGELFDEIKMTMPFSAPGSLTPEQYADALAYILSMNKYKAGDQELAHEVEPLKAIPIDAAQ